MTLLHFISGIYWTASGQVTILGSNTIKMPIISQLLSQPLISSAGQLNVLPYQRKYRQNVTDITAEWHRSGPDCAGSGHLSGFITGLRRASAMDHFCRRAAGFGIFMLIKFCVFFCASFTISSSWYWMCETYTYILVWRCIAHFMSPTDKLEKCGSNANTYIVTL